MNLTEKIKTLCDERGTTIFAVENATGLSNGSIVKWKSCTPSFRGVKSVAEFFRITIDELMKDVDLPEKKEASNDG